MTTPAPFRHPPLLEVTPTDHTAWIAIATVLGLCCAVVTALLRIFVRLVISPPFGHDDTVVLVATLLAIVQSAVVVYGVSMGLGRSTDLVSAAHLQALQKAAYASDILYLFTVYLSKCSVVLLLLRLSQDRVHRIAFNATLVGTLLRWQVVTAFDILTEAAIFGVSFYLIHGLHMSLSNKSIIVGVFAFRLVIIPFLIIRLLSFPHHHLSTDPSFTMTYFYIWTQTVLNLSLMVSTMPCLKPFVASLNTGYGAFDGDHIATHYGTYGSNSNRDNGGYPKQRRKNNLHNKWTSKIASGMSANKSNVDDRPKSIADRVAGHISRPQRLAADDESGIGIATAPTHNHHRQPNQFDAVTSLAPQVDAGQGVTRGGEGRAMTHTHSASAVAQDGNSIGSDDSRQMIIRKDMTWAVEYSDPSPRGR
ncbi:MAG: hypothetical protein Q9169_000785 [Polycauliona sp. 2 TL-2023]